MTGYGFSRRVVAAHAAGPHTIALIAVVNTIVGSAESGGGFNSMLVNDYTARGGGGDDDQRARLNGSRCIGQHSDDESSLGENGVFAFTWIPGKAKHPPRAMTFKPTKRNPGQPSYRLSLTHGQGILMKGREFQKLWTHGINKQAKADGRISGTFRRHLPGKSK
jgi:hypothetical protein